MPLQPGHRFPVIQVDNVEALVDDVITIRVTGLTKHQHITVYSSVTGADVEYAACGCFRADDNGEVDLTQSPSLQGTYTGVSAMGLFWSMRPIPGMPDGARLFKRNVNEPLNTTLRVLNGHLSLDEIYDCLREPVAEKKIRRWYLAKDVRKIPVKEGRIRGTLFLPPGDGPFPGVIDMFGGVGSLVEFRAALLASRRFACLALAFFAYDDLPKRLDDVQLEYFLVKKHRTPLPLPFNPFTARQMSSAAKFKEACDWFQSHPSVNSSGIGLIGVSKGGELSLRIACHSPKVKAVVCINGLPFIFAANIRYGGSVIPSVSWDNAVVGLSSEGFYMSDTLEVTKDDMTPLWTRHDVKVMLIAGGDDQSNPCKYLMDFKEHYPSEVKHNVDLVVYPGAGHLIEPPFAPLCRSSLMRYRTEDIFLSLWGGRVIEHAKAQEDSWKRILEFFRRELSETTGAVTNSIHCDSRL